VGLDNWGVEFPTTRWTRLVDVQANQSSVGADAFAEMIGRYWYPLYAYLRRQRYSSEDAQDYLQGFITYLLEADALKHLERNRSRFRSYLIGALKHYVSNEQRRDRAQKRGGGAVIVPIDVDLAEERYHMEPADERTPEKLFDRYWAYELLQQVMDRLEDDFRKKGKEDVFKALCPHLTGEAERGDSRTAARELGLSEENVRTIVSRMRRQFQVLLRQFVSETVDSDDLVDSEINYLMVSLGEN
jgi:RNA polymerase sigma-70 factor (ECF subfamily)